MTNSSGQNFCFSGKLFLPWPSRTVAVLKVSFSREDLEKPTSRLCYYLLLQCVLSLDQTSSVWPTWDGEKAESKYLGVQNKTKTSKPGPNSSVKPSLLGCERPPYWHSSPKINPPYCHFTLPQWGGASWGTSLGSWAAVHHNAKCSAYCRGSTQELSTQWKVEQVVFWENGLV